MESTTAMGMRKMGIMELMMCRVLPVPMSNPMVEITVQRAIIRGEMTSWKLRKKKSMIRKIISMASGAEIAIWMNISLPNVSSATGRPVM